MKTILLAIIALAGLNLHAQENTNKLKNANRFAVHVFKFNKKNDNMVYEETQEKKTLLYFEILLNNKKVKFYTSSIPEIEEFKINTTRKELEEIVKNDNPEKQVKYCIYVKEQDSYYYANNMLIRVSHY
ncbi:MAG: hypothetical protein ACN6OI_16710 [Flavobacterium sp.]|jgi:hypothetical protein|uniref:hypothetical protein n=1 Tax=Flavobacterium sp. TaxID=239 RepID=UPI003D10CBC8